MTQVVARQSDILCQSCAGQCIYDPGQQDLLCQSCGTLWPLATEHDHLAAEEFPFDPDLPRDEAPIHLGDHVHSCETCGGQVIFVGSALSENCPYCNGSVVLAIEDKAFETMALVPFRTDRDHAQKQIVAWIDRRIAAPKDLQDFTSRGRIAGIYAPFWTFDSREAIEYWASYTVGSGDKRRRKRKTGRMTVDFNDMLVPASPHVTSLIRDGILHDFDPSQLRPFRSGYLAGFAAERHHLTVTEGLQANAQDKDLLIRNRIVADVGKPNATIERYKTDTTGIHYRRILLPVWILHYSYSGVAKKVVVSGIDGRTFGERPFSRWKLAGYSAALTAATMLIGLIWGAGAAL